ncbi:30S ribosomal protein S18 [bacterium]|nr:30S ribosomal protein S18 [bacterium]
MRLRTTSYQRKPSYLDEHSIDSVDYKDLKLLQRFISPQGKILPRRITRLNTSQQRQVTQAIKRARHLALLPYTTDADTY